ncbi:MAG: acetylxylan esterase [Bryobacterales bacterium]|nr:acetylxylan esterase [Bryobacterales bacterium]
MRILALGLLFALLAPAQDLVVFPETGEGTHAQLTRRLNAIGQEHLARRAAAVAAIQTREQAIARQNAVREKILRLLGGLPAERTPLNTQHFGAVERGDYRFEKIIYESLPGFHVTANVYRPTAGNGPFPAILMPVGHSPEGKEGERTSAIALARKGFVVLKYDPIGQGERLQYYDPDLRTSRLGNSTQEHSHANGHTTLIGENVARYRVWDGIRGIDYLVSRQDVDPERIGCTGCSGGGTLTTYIAALDPRVKAAAPACYITSWEQLLEKLGPQDGEQSFHWFLSEGLNIGDYVALFAPKPWLIASTIDDFFPLEGARQTYEEAKRFYSLFGAADRVEWFIGPGPHGVPLPTRETVTGFFLRHLRNGEGDPKEAPVELDLPETLLVTRTGQVNDSLQSETVFTLNRTRAAAMMPKRAPIGGESDVAALRQRLRRDIREAAGIEGQPGQTPPRVTIHETTDRGTYALHLLSFPVDEGVYVTGVLLAPHASGRKPAVVVTDARPKSAQVAPGGDLDQLARAGAVVLAIQPRGTPETEPVAANTLVGDFQLAFRATLVAKTLTGMRASDILHAVDYLASRGDVDPARIAGLGNGLAGVYLLHAAVIDERIGRLAVQQTPALFRLAVERPIHRHLYEIAIPGVLTRYDLDELTAALAPRRVTWVNPVDTAGRPLRLAEFRNLYDYAMEADKKTGRAGRTEVQFRARRDGIGKFLGLP